jgi:broad specificity phosphatase PhoE
MKSSRARPASVAAAGAVIEPREGEALALLIRHGHTAAVGHCLVGRLPGIGLSDMGRVEVETLAAKLTATPLAAVYSSPLQRAMETARAVAGNQGLEVTCLDAVCELDFGEWTGRTFAELDADEAWQRFNASRSCARVPRGETALEVQARVVGALEQLGEIHRNQIFAVVSHQDVIRAALLYCAGMSLDLYDRFTVPPASITILSLGSSTWQILPQHHEVRTADGV